MIKMEIECKPVPFTRTYSHGKRHGNSARYHEYKELISRCASQAMNGRAPFAGEISMEIKVYRPEAKGKSVSFVGDVDNYAKAVLDALNGICYKDDQQVTKLVVRKVCGESKIEITLKEVGN